MERFTSSTPAGVDPLNKLFAVDAVVDPSWGTTSGFTYGSVTAALAAGHRTIYIKPGNSAEAVTISTSGVHLIGCGPAWDSSGSRLGSVTLASGAERFRAENISCVLSAGAGWTFAGLNNYAHLTNCFGYNCVGDGFSISGSQSGITLDNCVAQGCATGFKVNAPAAAQWFDNLCFNGCQAFYSDGNGFDIVLGGTGTSTVSSMKFLGCHSSFAAQQVSGFGFAIGARVNASLIGCQATNCGTGGGITGTGFWSNTTGIFSHQYVGCISKSNNDYGFYLSVASAKVSLVGCHQVNNTNGYGNCASSPGYTVAGAYGTNGAG